MDTGPSIRQAIDLAKSGKRPEARQILSQVVRLEPQNARAWYLLSQVEEIKEQSIYCLEQVLKIQPDNSQALERLRRLAAVAPITRAPSLANEQLSLDSAAKPAKNPLAPLVIIAVVIFSALCTYCILSGLLSGGDGDATPTPETVEAAPPPQRSTKMPPQQAVCNCSGDQYNCNSFPSSSAAQACFDYCMSTGHGDVHRLDRDGDGRVCEK